MIEQSVWSKTEKAAWALPADLTVSQWADDNRVLNAKVSAEHGSWRTSRTPYLRQIMDCFCFADIEEIDICKPVQSAGTEALLNMLGYAIDQDPGPALIVEPRDDDSDYMAMDRVKPMVEDSPKLSAHTTGRIWDLSKGEFNFDRMNVYFSASNSAAGLAIKAIRYLFLDEINKYPPFTSKEANPVDLAIDRTTTFWDRKIVKVSTPTTTDGNITRSIKKSELHRYYFACPKCGQIQTWIFTQLKIDKKLRDPDVIRNAPGCVWYECQYCKERIEETDKDLLIAAGQWCSVKLAKKGKFEFVPARHIGFHYNALISPWVSWTEIMARWFEANTEEGIAVGLLQRFKNHVLAEPWAETAVETEPEKLHANISKFSRGQVPNDCLILTCGADYHEDTRGQARIDYEVRGWAAALKNYVNITGSVFNWEEFEEEVLLHCFPWYELMGSREELAVGTVFIDSGYKPDVIYDFCSKYPGICWPTKGAATKRGVPIYITNLEKALGVRSTIYRGMQLINIDTDFFKDRVHGWATKGPGTPGSTTFYKEITDNPAYFKEFCNEQKIKVKTKYGQIYWRWKPVSAGAQTHFLDTAVGAAAAGWFRRVQYIRSTDIEQKIPAAITARRRIADSRRQISEQGPAGKRKIRTKY